MPTGIYPMKKRKGLFKKGHKSFSYKGMNKGMHCSKNSEFQKGQIPWNTGNGEYMKGENNHFFGKHHTEESKKKNRISSFKYIKKIKNINSPRIGRNETRILDELELSSGYKILRQFNIDGYFVDGYIPKLNIVIEVDERTKNTKKDIERENYIKNKLNCKLVRINDFSSGVWKA